MSYRDLPSRLPRLSALLCGILGGALGTLAVILLAAPACANAAMSVLLVIGLRG